MKTAVTKRTNNAVSSIVITGDPRSCFKFHGPFWKGLEEAVNWAKLYVQNGDSHYVVHLIDPPGYEVRKIGQWIVIAGNVVDGLFYYGPFMACEHAAEWAAAYLPQMDLEYFPFRMEPVKP